MTDALDALRAALPDLQVRRPRYLDDGVDVLDVDAAEELLARCDLAVVGERDSGREEVASMFTAPGNDRERTALIHDGDVLVGLIWIEHDPTALDTWIDVYADPERHTERLVEAGVQHGISAAAAAKAAAGAEAWGVRSGCFGTDAVLVRGLEGAGFACVRRFYRMRIDLATAALPAEAPAPPDGVTIVQVRSDEQRRRLHAVQQASFADHWNHTDRSFEELMERLESSGEQDYDGWWLLEVHGVAAAVCILDDSRLDLGDGYVRTLGVVREFRGRGLAQLLLVRAFVRYRDLGRAGVQLSVDSTSPTGADRLYRKVGMQVAREIDAWSRPI